MKRSNLMLLAVCAMNLIALPACYDGLAQSDTIVQREIDPGDHAYRSVVLTFQDGRNTPFATIYLFDKALGSFSTSNEYWYVNPASLSLLGSKPLLATTTDYDTTTAPSDPKYTNEQSFTLPVASNWGSGWTTDPLSGGSLYTTSGGLGLRVTSATNPTRVTSIAWYQVIPSGNTPVNLTPSGTFNVAGFSVTVPSGDLGYDISESP
jgi:hypothetical protein